MHGSLETLYFLLFDGFIWGLIIALIALGLSLIFGIMGIINMAHGDIFMIGGVLTVVLVARIGNLWPLLIIIPLIVGISALPVERWILRPYEGKPLTTMIATIGISFIIEEITLIFFGGAAHMVHEPTTFTVHLLGINYPGYNIIAGLVSMICILLLWSGLRLTKIGVYIRATIEEPEMADAIGINTGQIRSLTFAAGASLAAFGGVLAAPIHQVSYLMGQDVILFCFIVVIVGGLGNLMGTLVAAVFLSAVQEGLSLVFTPVNSNVIILLLMALILVIKPKGMFSS